MSIRRPPSKIPAVAALLALAGSAGSRSAVGALHAQPAVEYRGHDTRGGEIGPRGAAAPFVRDVPAVRPSAAGDCAAR